MAIGFPAKYSIKKLHSCSMQQAYNLALGAVEQTGWKEVGFLKDTNTYKVLDYKTIGSLLTFAERIKIYIGKTEILVVSECLFPAQFLDFGKNKRNVDAFYHLFDVIKEKQPNV